MQNFKLNYFIFSMTFLCVEMKAPSVCEPLQSLISTFYFFITTTKVAKIKTRKKSGSNRGQFEVPTDNSIYGSDAEQKSLGTKC